MDWRDQAGTKLVDPSSAVAPVKSGDTVAVAPFTCTPHTLCDALYQRRSELENVSIEHPASLYPWLKPGDENGFKVKTPYATPLDREAVNSGRIDYFPLARFRADGVPPGFTPEPDVYLLPVSPPDRNGFCSFGPGVWFSRTFTRQARTVVAEVHENFIRTGGENFVHISEIDWLTEAQQPTGAVPVPPRSDEESAVTEVICTLVATELVKDRDTMQIGIGTVSSALALYLGDKHDLGMQTEMIPGGVVDLVQQGVMTGRYKTLHRDRVVGSVLVAMPEEEMRQIDGNPAFELYEFGYSDDLRLLIQQDNLVAVNNALFVDLTGQVSSETIGPRIWTGVGGQTAFAIAAQYSRGGRTITVTPSSHVINGERVTRIVPMLPEGSVVTIPRTMVDFVVTEHGIATLHGKTLKERAGELISVAHPDFREELRKQAAALYAA
ncbi:MAG TPA: acetyl-CoA hydrolase/transferase C-terminal domain-containing protein [Dehalococcoidia bacterium]|nr:acetyl-CoA hydrolase/transferase C-terminal domain-containing protein [Dehalococcoidia bacterium]